MVLMKPKKLRILLLHEPDQRIKVEVLKNHVSMLGETAERSDEIDKVRSESAKERARKRLSQKTPDLDVDRARVALARAMNRLKIAQKG